MHRRPKLMTCYVKRDSGLATYVGVLCYGFEFINIRIEEKRFRNYARIFWNFDNKIDLSICLVVLSVMSWLRKPIRSLSGELSYSFLIWVSEKDITPGGGGLPYKTDGDARRKYWIRTPKVDQYGRGPSFLWPLKETKNTKYIIYFPPFLRVQP